MDRRPEHPGYRRFASRHDNRCAECRTSLPAGRQVLGTKLDGDSWHIVCEPCGGVPRRSGPNQPTQPSRPVGVPRPRAAPPRSWTTLVSYLTACVEREGQVDPVALKDQAAWTPLDLPAERVFGGDDRALPHSPELAPLFADLGDFEAVYYGWPTIVVPDRGRTPHVAPLFLHQLGAPRADGEDGELVVPLADSSPQLNRGLLEKRWWSPETLDAVEAAIPDAAIGFGRQEAVTALAKLLAQLLAGALGVDAEPIDPARLRGSAITGELARPAGVGVFNAAMAFRGTLDVASRGLLRDLRQIRKGYDLGKSAARFLIEDPPTGPVGLPDTCGTKLNDAQQQALASAATAPLTVITGPPGTGKSQTVAGIVAEAWVRGESVLLASTNNAPLDDVIDSKARRIHDALVLRTGNAGRRSELGARLAELLGDGVDGGVVGGVGDGVGDAPADDDIQLPRLTYRRARQQLGDHTGAAQRLLDAALQRDGARRRVWGDAEPPVDLDHDGVRRKVDRALRTRWRWLAARRTTACFRLLGVTDQAVPLRELAEWLEAETAYAEIAGTADQLRAADTDRMLVDLDSAESAWREASEHTTVRKLVEGFAAGREALERLARSLGNDGARTRAAMREAMGFVRGWATTTLSVESNFDDGAGTIDLVVIDEASQCSLASVLPLAFRAKRLVVIGDPWQLPPVVRTDTAELQRIAARTGADHERLVAAHQTFGEDSAYTAFEARVRGEPFLLDEHYRCHPDIIRFCNEEFYAGRLRVLSTVDTEDPSPRGLFWHDVAGVTEPGPGSGPGRSVVNVAEAEAIAAWVASSPLPPGSIGVVTPFRAQVPRIRQALRAVAPDGRLADVRVGTAHTFQGSARPTMLLSTVLAAEASPGTVNWLEDQRNLINVAVSRAERHLVVFGDRAQLQRLGAQTLLALARAAGATGSGPAASTPALDRLRAALVRRGVTVTEGGSAEGYPLALTVRRGAGVPLDLEVTELAAGQEPVRVARQLAGRDACVSALGFEVVRVPGWSAYLEPDAVAERVVARIMDG